MCYVFWLFHKLSFRQYKWTSKKRTTSFSYLSFSYFMLGVSSVCGDNWTDTLICRNLATQLSGRLLIIPNQITQKPEIKTSSQQRWGQTRTEWELNAPMGLIRNHGRGNRVGKCLPCTEAELKEAWNHMFGCLSIYHCKSRMYPSGILKTPRRLHIIIYSPW